MAKAKKTTKKVAKKSVKKASPKKTAKKTVKQKEGKERETVRTRALKALKRKDMTAGEVQEAVGLSHGLKPTLDDEVERGHLVYVASKTDEGPAVYHLTTKGKKALDNGTVNPTRTASE